MDDNKRDFNGFFERKREDEEQNGGETSEKHQSYYYSYGPFKGSAHDDRAGMTTSVSGSGETSPVEVTAPRPVRPYGYGQQDEPRAGVWTYGGTPKRSSAKGMFVSFLAGAVIVGSLMFASDKMNWFTSAPVSEDNAPSYGNSVAVDSGRSGGSISSANIVRPNTIADIAEKASPAVVKIETYANSASRRNPALDDPFFRNFFDDNFFGEIPQQQQKKQMTGMGSGFIFDKSGYILTNEHVIDGADEVYVTVEGHKNKYKAKVLGSEYNMDLAVIKIDGDNNFPTLKLGNSNDMRVGDWVTAIGNPVGFDHSVSVGVVSAKGRNFNIPDQQGNRRYTNMLQTDASINPGNSGGPLLNLNGEVIGINTAINSQAQGIGFAIPTSTISSVLDNLKNNVKVPQPYIGVYLQDIPENLLQELKLDSTDGTIVTQIEYNSPAHDAGLQPYDVIVEYNGKAVQSTEDFVAMVQKSKVGERATLTIVRGGKKIEAGVIIGDRGK